VREPTDPIASHEPTPPAGLRKTGSPAPLNVVLVQSVGVAVVGTRAEGEETQMQLALSLVGRINKRSREVHHLHFLSPRMAGLMMAQLAWWCTQLNEEFHATYAERMQELIDEQLAKDEQEKQ